MRASRVIRQRLARKSSQAPKPRAAETVTITDAGVAIDGHALPWWIGTDLTIDHYADDFHLVTFGVFTDAVTVARPLPARTSVTERFHA